MKSDIDLIMEATMRIHDLYRHLLYFTAFVGFVFLASGCATPVTSAGINRALLFKDVPKVNLPYKVVLGENSKRLECATGVDDGLSSGGLFAIGGAGGIAGGKAAQATGIQSFMRGKFIAGEAFDNAARAISSPGQSPLSIIQLQIIRFQPMLIADKKRRRLVAIAEFSSVIMETGKIARSIYSFEYTIDSMDLFGSSKEKDLLREMVDYTLAHWAQQLSMHSGQEGPLTEFPLVVEGKMSFRNTEGSYIVFARP